MDRWRHWHQIRRWRQRRHRCQKQQVTDGRLRLFPVVSFVVIVGFGDVSGVRGVRGVRGVMGIMGIKGVLDVTCIIGVSGVSGDNDG